MLDIKPTGCCLEHKLRITQQTVNSSQSQLEVQVWAMQKRKKRMGLCPTSGCQTSLMDDRLNCQPSSKDYNTRHALWSVFDLLSSHEEGGKKVAEGMCSAQGNRSLLRGLVFIAPDRPIPKLEEACGSRSYRAPFICSSRTFRVPKGRFSAGLAKYKINHDIYRRRKRVSRLT